MAEPWAMRHKALEEAHLHGAGRGEEPAPRGLPARAVAARDRPPAGARPLDARLLRPQRRRPRNRSSNLPARSVLEADHPELAGKFVLLFFGRVHVKKGLDLLAEALGRLAPDVPELHLLLSPATTTGPGAVREPGRGTRA